MPIRLNGSTSGYSQLEAPAIAGDQLFTLPGAGGTLDRINRAGNVLQVVNFQTGTVATGTTILPLDNTIPQNTEGVEFMTLAVTPTSSSSKLVIDVIAMCSHSQSGSALTAALFQDSTANALATGWTLTDATASALQVVFRHYMTAGTTSSTTFKVRIGSPSVGTTTFNGAASTAYLNGTLASSITITEVAA